MRQTINLPTESDLNYLVGDINSLNTIHPLTPYHPIVCEFLSDLSKIILANAEAKQYPDVISFAYWCRKSNITKTGEEFKTIKNRIGLGLVFHITPTNVPVNFAFSYVFSLLAGNANIVRVPSKNFIQVTIICRALNELFKQDKYKDILEKSVFVRYAQNDQITSQFSSICNARIIWGGDTTIKNVRQMQIPPRSIDIAFADRYSFCIINPESILDADDIKMKSIAEKFYNDTFLMDQNACSSPHLVVWKTDKTSQLKTAKEKFWKYVLELTTKKYDLQAVNAIDKYTQLCHDAIENKEIKSTERLSNFVFLVDIKQMPEHITNLSGKFGYFYEVDISNIDELKNVIETKIQTITYLGVDKTEILNFVINNGLIGVDRIVPIGKALDIGIIWDGFDTTRTLSRIVDVQ